jgi:hypothetical protein
MTKELVKENIEINCVSCGRKITEVWICKLEVPHITKYVFFCSSCQRCLGVSDSKNPDSIIKTTNDIPPVQLQY